MTLPTEPPPDAAALAGMERLIVAMKGQRPDPAAAEPTAGATPEASDDDQLAAAAWGAMNLPLRDETNGEAPVAGSWAYLERGALVGRYMVLRELGAGGMGVVYVAYDPELDRKVALKLVLPGKAGMDGRARLLREAQALAKLSHRNVVAIHDVGTMGEQVWLAMELVRGQTLREWLKEPRDWREVSEVMRKAGRGLAAAHEAGLLHRDFKPENVMVGERGRVRVMDFGLARARSNAVPVAAEESTVEALPVADALALRVTQAGTLLGTPPYMAPEQFLGEELTSAVDQFALCVTLWEGLYGQRPFKGATLDELFDDMLAGRAREPPKGRAVPGWLRRVCERGLSAQPQQRFASMKELLDTLAKGRTRAQVRKGLAAVGVLAVLGAGADGYRRYDIAQRTAACEASGAEIETAWNPERRQVLHDALVATGVSFAATTADKTMPWLERQAVAWREARVEACLDTEVRGRWDAETLDRSLWCLDERRMQLESLVEELTLADAEVLHRAVAAAAGLALVAPCRDVGVLEARAPPPLEDREAVRAVRADVTRVETLELAGRYTAGLELARGALERAEGLHWRPLSASARVRLGSLLARAGAQAEAETALEDAYFEAAEGVAPEVVFAAATMLVYVVGVSSARHAEGRRWGRHAEVALASIRDGEQLGRAILLGALAEGHAATGDYDEAKVLHERALAIEERALGPEHPHVTTSLNNLANVHTATGGYVEAKALHERALAINEKVLGPEHLDVAYSLNNLAVVHKAAGAYAEAKALVERAIAIKERALGPDHPDVASSLGNLAVIHEATGAHTEAKALYERVLAIREQALGPEHPRLSSPLVGLARVALEQRRPIDAVSLAQRAVAVLEKQELGALTLAEARFVLAQALWDLPVDGGRDRARAVALAEQARADLRDAGLGKADDLAEAVERWIDDHRGGP